LAEQVERVEESLWAALRALEEHGKLTKKILAHAEERKLSGWPAAMKRNWATSSTTPPSSASSC
jgi:hypothetical protein